MSAPAAAQAKTGGQRKKYQALTNLSIPQRHPGTEVLTGQNDLVVTGDTVELTDEEARNLMATGPRAGRQTPAIRPASEAKTELPRLHPRQLSGNMRAPVQPPPDSDMPRPDPPGSSKVIIQEPPESNEPAPGGEQLPVTGAIDLPPRAAR
jgi:hypothetical protein